MCVYIYIHTTLCIEIVCQKFKIKCCLHNVVKQDLHGDVFNGDGVFNGEIQDVKGWNL